MKVAFSYCIFLLAIIAGTELVYSADETSFISPIKIRGCLTLSASGNSSPIVINSSDYSGVIRAGRDLQSDMEKVTGFIPAFSLDTLPHSREIIIIGTIGKSKLINDLASRKKLDVSGIKGKWESYIIEVIKNPFPGIKKAVVIAGSDKRGTIFGIYEVSVQIGVSPWYWWADVPARHKDAIYILPGRYQRGEPSVKYRGIFLNDEAPALTNWVEWKYGKVNPSVNPPVPPGPANYNHEFYSRIFELILRLRGNYLWPAMWNNAFNEDDTLNPGLADEYGIVMGTSHQEPMLRAQKEWDRRYLGTLGTWNYSKHTQILEEFWKEGIRRNRNYESIITIGLRGANDTEMAPGGPEANKALLEKIVSVQRKIISDQMGIDVSKVPQLWCLYKEVQDYYNAGMRVPEDVTLLWAEDNWGNIRRLPTADERQRSGGAGIYYHFDYHGGPRSYQWINTNPIAKIWDQMTLAKQYGADRIWIVNVGHFKGYEFPLEYFMSLAWDTENNKATDINDYTRRWAAREFGAEYADRIAEIISRYTRYNGRRKPELLGPLTYSLVNYREAETIVADYKAIATSAEELYSSLPGEMRDAFYQLVLFPVKACSLVNELYFSAGKNALYAKQGRATTNEMASQTKLLFQSDTSLMGYYNRSFAGGKWNHFMDQTHLGYTSWVDPPSNSLRAIKLIEKEIPDISDMGVSVEGSENIWPGSDGRPLLPEFDVFNRQERYIEIFNKGKKPFSFTAVSDSPWLVTGEKQGTIVGEKRLIVSIDWNKVPEGRNSGILTINGTGKEVAINISAFRPAELKPGQVKGFIECEGFVSVEAEHYSKKVDVGQYIWQRVEDYGKTLSGMRATAPVDAPAATPGNNSPCLEYQMYLFTSGEIETGLTLSPTLNFIPGRDLRIAVSFDKEIPRIITIVPADFNAQNRNSEWEKSVMDNARYRFTKHTIKEKGYHTLKIWMVDPGVVLEKIVVNTGGVRPSYLGPPESYNSLFK